MLKIKISIISAIALLIFVYSSQSQIKKSYLTIEETLELVKKQYFDYIPEEDIIKSKKANPAARPFLYNILKDTGQKEIWTRTVGIFADLGKEEDVATLEQFIKDRKGIINGDEYNATMMVLTVFGAMAERGIKPAEQLHKKMLYPLYWQNVHFSLSKDRTPTNADFQIDMVLEALAGYAYANDPKFQEIADSVYQRISLQARTSEQKTFLKKKTDDILEFYKEVQKGKKGN